MSPRDQPIYVVLSPAWVYVVLTVHTYLVYTGKITVNYSQVVVFSRDKPVHAVPSWCYLPYGLERDDLQPFQNRSPVLGTCSWNLSGLSPNGPKRDSSSTRVKWVYHSCTGYTHTVLWGNPGTHTGMAYCKHTQY